MAHRAPIANRDAAIESLLPLVNRIALKIAYAVRVNDLADLISDGQLAAISAVDSYDPSRGASLTTWATWLIRGQILNGVRDRQPIPEYLRRVRRQAQKHIHIMEAALGRPPTVAEIEAEFPGYERALRAEEVWNARSLSENAIPVERGGCVSLRDVIRDDGASVEDELLRRERDETLTNAIRALPDKWRAVIEGIYYRGQFMRDIAAQEHITQQRVSAIRRRAIEQLREHLSEAFAEKVAS